jgi:hypothetical protein
MVDPCDVGANAAVRSAPTILAHCAICSQFLAVHIMTMFANSVSHPGSTSV